MYIVPNWVAYCPKTEPDIHFMMIELVSSAHTGTNQTEIAVSTDKQKWI